jgi:hypothetical protein
MSYYFVDPPEGVEVEGAGQKLLAGEETTFTCTARNASGLLAFREHTIDKKILKNSVLGFAFFFFFWLGWSMDKGSYRRSYWYAQPLRSTLRPTVPRYNSIFVAVLCTSLR